MAPAPGLPRTRRLRRKVAGAGSTAWLIGELDDFTEADLRVLVDVPFATLVSTAEEEALRAGHTCLGLEHVSCAALRLLGDTSALERARQALLAMPSPVPGLINVKRLQLRLSPAQTGVPGRSSRGETTRA